MPEVVPSCLWRATPELIVALDDRFGEPVDSYVNGSQTWLRDDGRAGDARVAAASGRRIPATAAMSTPGSCSRSRALRARAPATSTRAAHRAVGRARGFAAYGDEIEPAQLAAARDRARIGIAARRFGLVDHEAIGDAWERANGKVSIVALLLDQLTG